MSQSDEQDKRIAALEATIARMQRQHAAVVESLQAFIRRQDAELRDLRRRLAKYEGRGGDRDDNDSRGGPPQLPPVNGAPTKRKPDRKRPGRTPGEGTFEYRQMPTPTEPLVHVEQPSACRACGGRELERVGSEVVTITTLPPMPAPIVTPYEVPTCRCAACGKNTRGTHPDIAPDQTGASANRFSPLVMTIAHLLHYGYRLPACALPSLLRDLFGIKITKGAIIRDALRRGTTGSIGEVYRELREEVREADYVYTDDTYWPIHGDSAFLMGFSTMNRPREAADGDGDAGTTPEVAIGDPLAGRDPPSPNPRAAQPRSVVFQIRRCHTNAEVRELVPGDFAGMMKTDRFSSYDAEEFDAVAQDKCLAHGKRNVRDAIELQHPGARSFTYALERLIDAAIALWHRFRDDQVDLAEYAVQAAPLKLERDDLLRDRWMRDAHNQRLLDGFGYHADRGRFLAFLDDPWLEPTNNRAERALRDPVIARRLSHGSKNDRGADTYCAFLSVLHTLRARSAHVLSSLHRLIIGDPLAEVTR